MTGLLVVLMNVLIAARNPESSSKITSTSSNRMSDVAVFLLCSSLLFCLGLLVARDLFLSLLSLAFMTFLEGAIKIDQ